MLRMISCAVAAVVWFNGGIYGQSDIFLFSFKKDANSSHSERNRGSRTNQVGEICNNKLGMRKFINEARELLIFLWMLD